MAALFTDDPLPVGLRDLLGGHDLVLAYTRTQRLVDRLSSINGTVIARDPQPPPAGPHAADWLASSLDAAGIPPVVLSPALLAATPEEEDAARPWLERLPPRFLAVHPGSGSPAKNWPATRFAELLDGWRGPTLVVEGPADSAAVGTLRSRAERRRRPGPARPCAGRAPGARRPRPRPRLGRDPPGGGLGRTHPRALRTHGSRALVPSRPAGQRLDGSGRRPGPPPGRVRPFPGEFAERNARLAPPRAILSEFTCRARRAPLASRQSDKERTR